MAFGLLNDALTREERKALAELKSALTALLGDRLVRFVLFGSRARGDYDPESDVDVAIIIRGLTRGLKKEVVNLVADIEVKHIAPLVDARIVGRRFQLSEDEGASDSARHRERGDPLMTQKNRKKNIKDELSRASKAMESAVLLFDHGLLNDAVSRLYYYLLHTIRALLLTKGLDPKMHGGVLRVFSVYFVKEGIFELKASHLFARLMKYREEADDNPSYVSTGEDFIEFRSEAEDLAGSIKDCVREKGYL